MVAVSGGGGGGSSYYLLRYWIELILWMSVVTGVVTGVGSIRAKPFQRARGVGQWEGRGGPCLMVI